MPLSPADAKALAYAFAKAQRHPEPEIFAAEVANHFAELIVPEAPAATAPTNQPIPTAEYQPVY